MEDATDSQAKVETETRETQTDMPMCSNMKVGSTQTDEPPVERMEIMGCAEVVG